MSDCSIGGTLPGHGFRRHVDARCRTGGRYAACLDLSPLCRQGDHPRGAEAGFPGTCCPPSKMLRIGPATLRVAWRRRTGAYSAACDARHRGAGARHAAPRRSGRCHAGTVIKTASYQLLAMGTGVVFWWRPDGRLSLKQVIEQHEVGGAPCRLPVRHREQAKDLLLGQRPGHGARSSLSFRPGYAPC